MLYMCPHHHRPYSLHGIPLSPYMYPFSDPCLHQRAAAEAEPNPPDLTSSPISDACIAHMTVLPAKTQSAHYLLHRALVHHDVLQCAHGHVDVDRQACSIASLLCEVCSPSADGRSTGDACQAALTRVRHQHVLVPITTGLSHHSAGCSRRLQPRPYPRRRASRRRGEKERLAGVCGSLSRSLRATHPRRSGHASTQLNESRAAASCAAYVAPGRLPSMGLQDCHPALWHKRFHGLGLQLGAGAPTPYTHADRRASL